MEWLTDGNLALVIIAGATVWAGVFLLLTAVLYWLWNMTVPEVFGLPEVTYWQALRVLVIASILFSGPMLTFGFGN